MESFLFWFLISIVCGAILFPITYFYSKWESTRNGETQVKRTSLIQATVMALWPVMGCLVTWAGIWLNL